MDQTAIYDLLAAVLAYPDEHYRAALEQCRAAVEPVEPEADRLLQLFAGRIDGLSVDELQELYTQTFDLDPMCSLEVGWHLFGENYDRGGFLVKMREELGRHGVPESAELPDHLTHVLALLGRLESGEAEPFARLSVLPAVEKMLAGLAGKRNPYEHVVKAIFCVVSNRDVLEGVDRE